MTILAIEQSSSRGSLAILRSGEPLLERSWEHTSGAAEDLFGVLRRVLDREVEPGAVKRVVAGLGPGSFAGTRMALSVARAFALPGGIPVDGVSSGEALACDLHRETGADTVVVLGDARRGHAWFARFDCSSGSPVIAGSWALQPVESLGEVVSRGDLVAGPDWDRLGDRLKAVCSAGTRLIEESRFPSASGVANLAGNRMDRHTEPMPLVPIYLHPPVFVEPRF